MTTPHNDFLSRMRARQQERRAYESNTHLDDRFVETFCGTLLDQNGDPVNFPLDRYNPRRSFKETNAYNRAVDVSHMLDHTFTDWLMDLMPDYYSRPENLEPIGA